MDQLPISILRSLLAQNCQIKMNAQGFSMLPTIQPGATLLISSISEVVTGKVYLYESMNQLIVHRLVEIKESPLLTLYFKGDANKMQDPPVKPGQLIGAIALVNNTGNHFFGKAPLVSMHKFWKKQWNF